MPAFGTSGGKIAPGTSVPMGNWVIGLDDSGKVYLFQEGAKTRFGGTATAENLPRYLDFGTADMVQMSTQLSQKIFQLGNVSPVQASGLIASVDRGNIMAGGKYVAIPATQRPGQTIASQGQRGYSEAYFAPIIGGANAPGGPTNNWVHSVVDAIGSTLDFFKWISWIFHPLNILRAVEFLTGAGLMLYGLSTLMGVMRRQSATHRGGLGAIIGALPWVRAARAKRAVSAARKRGRAAGSLQGERDVAYRESRREVLRGSTNPPREKQVRERAAANGNG